MKELNKLYCMHRKSGDFSCSTTPFGGSTEYIRKDALIERLKKVAAEYKKRSDEGELVWQHMGGINEAISILNEM